PFVLGALPSPTGCSSMSGSGDGRIHLFTLASRRPYPPSIPGDFNLGSSIVPGPDLRTVLVLRNESDQGTGSIQVWQLRNLPSPGASNGRTTLVAPGGRLRFALGAFSPDRRTAFVVGAGPTHDDDGCLLDVASGSPRSGPLDAGP